MQGGGTVFRVAGQAHEARQHAVGHAVARRDGRVEKDPLSQQQLLGIVGREVEPALRGREMGQHGPGEFLGRHQPIGLARGLVEFEQAPGQEGVIVEQAGSGRLAVAQAVHEPAVLATHGAKQGICGRDRPVGEFRVVKGPGRLGQGGEQQTVPVREHLVVAKRPDAPAPGVQQHGPAAGQARFQVLRVQALIGGQPVQGHGEIRNVGAGGLAGGFVVKIAFLGKAVGRAEKLRVREQQFPHFGHSPDVEFSFHAFAVGILGAVAQAVRAGQVTPYVVEDVPGRLFEIRPSRGQEALGIGHGEQGLVVEHLFEMGQKPAVVRGVAVEAEAHMVPDATGAHGGKRGFDHG